jgi:hypothetical protein
MKIKEQKERKQDLERSDPQAISDQIEQMEGNRLEPVPNIYEIERNFNERVSALGIFSMHEKVNKLEPL